MKAPCFENIDSAGTISDASISSRSEEQCRISDTMIQVHELRIRDAHTVAPSQNTYRRKAGRKMVAAKKTKKVSGVDQLSAAACYEKWEVRAGIQTDSEDDQTGQSEIGDPRQQLPRLEEI
ncbi:hypothetical protein ACRRTK_024319 [Alexandromys fortis]